jgi:APA family basic amino acid/polyamine antiporter
MLGIGIFLAPPVVAASVPSVPVYLLVWLLGGLTALAGAVACAELGVLMPKAGGDYVFLREAYGESVAFAGGWVLFAGVFAGSIASMAVPLCQFELPPLIQAVSGAATPPDLGAPLAGLPVSGAQALAVLVVLGLTGLNALGTRHSARTQTVLTTSALLVLAGFALAGFAGLGRGPVPVGATAGALTASGLVAAYLKVYFAYAGWNAIIYVAGEVKRPERTIPLALIGGTLAVTALYLMLAGSFAQVLGLVGLSGAGEAGTATAVALGGAWLRVPMLLLITVGLVGCLNATVMAGGRVAFAMAGAGVFWGGAGRLSPRRQTPARALWAQAAVACALVLTGTYQQAWDLTSIAMQVTGFLAVAAVFVLRRTRPDAPRPYRATLYPWLPGLYLLSCLVVVGVKGWEALVDPQAGTWLPLAGLVLFVVAWLGHAGWSRRRAGAGA